MIYKSYYVSNQFEILHSIFSIILRQSIVWQSVSMTFFSFCGSALWLYILFFSACRIKHIINTHTLFLFGSNYQPVKKVWNYFFWKKNESMKVLLQTKFSKYYSHIFSHTSYFQKCDQILCAVIRWYRTTTSITMSIAQLENVLT